ncbi:hypothetical protein [Enhygromyxa salina]|uniref:hypothetical protein n=1 Tax=Enhygromyxa salina TaxID=215803 RepID=UPI0011B27D94|nr:hypothetical protein [Enhygromyxa salina]
MKPTRNSHAGLYQSAAPIDVAQRRRGAEHQGQRHRVLGALGQLVGGAAVGDRERVELLLSVDRAAAAQRVVKPRVVVEHRGVELGRAIKVSFLASRGGLDPQIADVGLERGELVQHLDLEGGVRVPDDR